MNDAGEQAGLDSRSLAGIRFRYEVGLHGPMPGEVVLTVAELGLLLDRVDELEDLRAQIIGEWESA